MNYVAVSDDGVFAMDANGAFWLHNAGASLGACHIHTQFLDDGPDAETPTCDYAAYLRAEVSAWGRVTTLVDTRVNINVDTKSTVRARLVAQLPEFMRGIAAPFIAFGGAEIPE